MADKKKDKEHKSIDDLFDDFKTNPSKDLDASFKAHDAFMKDEFQNHLYVNILAPGQDALYNAVVSELDKVFEKDDTKKINKNKKDIEKAITSGLKHYFEKSQPSVAKAIEKLGLSDEDQYDFLTSVYDNHIGAGQIEGVNSIKGLANLTKNKKMTVGHLKKAMYQQKPKHLEGALNVLVSKHHQHHFSKFQPYEVATYLKPKLEKEGFEIEDKIGYSTANIGALLGLRAGIINKEGHQYLKKKSDKKK